MHLTFLLVSWTHEKGLGLTFSLPFISSWPGKTWPDERLYNNSIWMNWSTFDKTLFPTCWMMKTNLLSYVFLERKGWNIELYIICYSLFCFLPNTLRRLQPLLFFSYMEPPWEWIPILTKWKAQGLGREPYSL